MIRRIGMIGLGKMGLPMSRHLIARGFAVAGYDLSAERCAMAADLGVTLCADPRAVAERSDLVIVVVGFDAEVFAVLQGPQGVYAGLAAGGIVAISSTVLPETMTRIAAEVAALDRGIGVIDIPTCRSERAAEKGTLLVLGGGDAVLFDRCRPAFETFATDIDLLGGIGAGQVGKLINNLLLWACISANYEGLKLGEALGVDPEKLRLALLKSSGQNWALETWLEPRPMPWAEKDMTIVAREADRVRVSLPLCGVVKEVVKGIKIERGLPAPVVQI